jgi:hypothetical protein
MRMTNGGSNRKPKQRKKMRMRMLPWRCDTVWDDGGGAAMANAHSFSLWLR